MGRTIKVSIFERRPAPAVRSGRGCHGGRGGGRRDRSSGRGSSDAGRERSGYDTSGRDYCGRGGNRGGRGREKRGEPSEARGGPGGSNSSMNENKSSGICNDWLDGTCTREDCRYRHSIPKQASSTGMEGSIYLPNGN